MVIPLFTDNEQLTNSSHCFEIIVDKSLGSRSAVLPKVLPNYFANSIGNELYLYGKKCSSLHGQL
jgi:hypothetical protein